MALPDPAALIRARTLLENLRRTPMSRGGRVGEPKRQLRDHMATAFEAQGVPTRLAGRMAFQFILKIEPRHLGDDTVWSALGWRIHDEVHQLQQRLHLTERLITGGVPKLLGASDRAPV